MISSFDASRPVTAIALRLYGLCPSHATDQKPTRENFSAVVKQDWVRGKQANNRDRNGVLDEQGDHPDRHLQE